MIIPPSTILNLKTRKPPIANLSERELHEPEGVGFDLRLDGVLQTEGKGALRCDTRQTSGAKALEGSPDGTYMLEHGEWYLVTTMETMNLPLNMAGLVFPRSTLFRSGVALHTSVVPPGYSGPLTFGLSVAMKDGFLIERAARFCHLVLFAVGKGATKYRGQWNFGRIVAETPERQK